MEEVTSYNNLSLAFDAVLSGTKRKKSKQGKALIANRDSVISELSSSLNDGSFQLGDYRQRTICEYGKERNLQIFSIKTRIAVYAIMNIVDKYMHGKFIRTTGASIKNRGTHDLMRVICRDMQHDQAGTLYAYKFDIRKFYDSIQPKFVYDCYRKIFKDERLLSLLRQLLFVLPHGISFGLRSSQTSGNLLLSVYLDHVLKDKLGVKYYYRYCDDGLVLSNSKTTLWELRNLIKTQVERIGLCIKPNERVFPVTEGIDFLGYMIYPDYSKLRKRVKKRYAKKLHEIKSRRRKRELVASFYGMAKHANCHNLYYALTGNKIMKSFKDLKVAYKPQDGKKRFNGTLVSFRELVNLPIVVNDYETGIKTAQGEDRCLISIEVNGEPKKVFTNSEEIKNILAQIKQEPDGFPFTTVVKTETFGRGRTKFIFT